MRIVKNATERMFQREALARGWLVSKKGWPDFFCVTPSGDIVLVEVKAKPGDSLSSEQYAVMRLLVNKGLDVRVFRAGELQGPLSATDLTALRPPQYSATVRRRVLEREGAKATFQREDEAIGVERRAAKASRGTLSVTPERATLGTAPL